MRRRRSRSGAGAGIGHALARSGRPFFTMPRKTALAVARSILEAVARLEDRGDNTIILRHGPEP